jgi:putative ABC transport system permease protein
MHQWLQNYAFQTDLKWWVFVLPGVLIMLIAWLTVSYQSLKAAFMNPAKSLRNE